MRCLLVTLPLMVLKAGVYRRTRRWLAALVPVFLAFSLWDWLAIRRGHWSYSSSYTTGIELLGLPLEELVFFLVVPTCALLTYQAVVRLLPSRPRTPPVSASTPSSRPPGSSSRSCSSCWSSGPACSATSATGSPWPSSPASSCW